MSLYPDKLVCLIVREPRTIIQAAERSYRSLSNVRDWVRLDEGKPVIHSVWRHVARGEMYAGQLAVFIDLKFETAVRAVWIKLLAPLSVICHLHAKYDFLRETVIHGEHFLLSLDRLLLASNTSRLNIRWITIICSLCAMKTVIAFWSIVWQIDRHFTYIGKNTFAF